MNNNSWLQTNWRPLTMLTFLILIVLDAFGLLAKDLPVEIWKVMLVTMGGYTIGRTAEKVAPHINKQKDSSQ